MVLMRRPDFYVKYLVRMRHSSTGWRASRGLFEDCTYWSHSTAEGSTVRYGLLYGESSTINEQLRILR